MRLMLLLIAAIFLLLPPSISVAQIRDFNRENTREFRPRPMMIMNDTRREHTRQGAKCLNAYPENHADFSRCMQNERASAPDVPQDRQLFMPVRASPRPLNFGE